MSIIRPPPESVVIRDVIEPNVFWDDTHEDQFEINEDDDDEESKAPPSSPSASKRRKRNPSSFVTQLNIDSLLYKYYSSTLKGCDICYRWDVTGLMQLHDPDETTNEYNHPKCQYLICLDCYCDLPTKTYPSYPLFTFKVCPYCNGMPFLRPVPKEWSAARRVAYDVCLRGMQQLNMVDQNRVVITEEDEEKWIAQTFPLFPNPKGFLPHLETDQDWLQHPGHIDLTIVALSATHPIARVIVTDILPTTQWQDACKMSHQVLALLETMTHRYVGEWECQQFKQLYTQLINARPSLLIDLDWKMIRVYGFTPEELVELKDKDKKFIKIMVPIFHSTPTDRLPGRNRYAETRLTSIYGTVQSHFILSMNAWISMINIYPPGLNPILGSILPAPGQSLLPTDWKDIPFLIQEYLFTLIHYAHSPLETSTMIQRWKYYKTVLRMYRTILNAYPMWKDRLTLLHMDYHRFRVLHLACYGDFIYYLYDWSSSAYYYFIHNASLRIHELVYNYTVFRQTIFNVHKPEMKQMDIRYRVALHQALIVNKKVKQHSYREYCYRIMFVLTENIQDPNGMTSAEMKQAYEASGFIDPRIATIPASAVSSPSSSSSSDMHITAAVVVARPDITYPL